MSAHSWTPADRFAEAISSGYADGLALRQSEGRRIAQDVGNDAGSLDRISNDQYINVARVLVIASLVLVLADDPELDLILTRWIRAE